MSTFVDIGRTSEYLQSRVTLFEALRCQRKTDTLFICFIFIQDMFSRCFIMPITYTLFSKAKPESSQALTLIAFRCDTQDNVFHITHLTASYLAYTISTQFAKESL